MDHVGDVENRKRQEGHRNEGVPGQLRRIDEHHRHSRYDDDKRPGRVHDRRPDIAADLFDIACGTGDEITRRMGQIEIVR